MKKKRKKIIVIIFHLPWDFPADFTKQISRELAKEMWVIAYNPFYFPTFKNLIFNRKKREKWRALFREKGIIYFPSVAIIPFQRVAIIERLNRKINFLFFRVFYFLRFGWQKPIFWTFSCQFAELLGQFRWREILVYDRVDQVSSLNPKENKAIKDNDQRLLKAADYVFTNSPYALTYIKKYNKSSFLTPWGYTPELFERRKAKIPIEIKKIKKPRIGFVGGIDYRLDFKILFPLAKRRKDWNFIFIGGAFCGKDSQLKIINFKKNLARLKSLPNTYFLGKKPKKLIPDFISGLDVCFIPCDVSQEFVKGSNPMKLYEYLAMGKPVVSTPIPAIEIYSPIVKIGRNAQEFEEKIKECLRMKDNKEEIKKRQKIARENSWEKKVKKMLSKIKR